MIINKFFYFWEKQRVWSDETFGTGYRTSGVLNHIRKECDEIEADPQNVEEWGDLFALVCDGARRAGFDSDDIINQALRKLEINKTRKWGEPDEHGTVEHIRDEAKS